MRRLLAALAALALSTAFATGCGSSSPASPPSPPPATPPSPSAVNALADLPQDLSLAPGTRNSWDLDGDFALGDGGDDQFDRAVQLYLGRPSTPPTPDLLPSDLGPVLPFPLDQRQVELSFTTPVVSRSAGLAAVVAAGNVAMGKELVLAASWAVPAGGGAVVGTRLSQAIDLPAGGGNLLLGWTHRGVVLDAAIPGGGAGWRVTVQPAAGGNALIAFSTGAGSPGPVTPIDLAPLAGQSVLLTFELIGTPRSAVAIDDVSIMSGATQLIANGSFESGALAPWTVTGPDQPCQVVSGKRTVGGLVVERRVFARPDRRWARYVDRFQNTGSSAVTTEASYLHELGALSDAVIQASGGGKAFSSWDASGFSPARRDLAVVHGTSPLPAAYRGATGLGAGDGSPWAWTRFPLTVPPGQTRVIVQFVVLTERRTGDGAPVGSSRALEADQEAAAIVSGFWSDPAYREGMTAEDEAALVNF